MNREKALEIARELKECSEKYDSLTFLEHDTEFFDYVIKELERTAQEVPVQEQYVTLKIDSKEIAKVVINEINKLSKQSNTTILSV